MKKKQHQTWRTYRRLVLEAGVKSRVGLSNAIVPVQVCLLREEELEILEGGLEETRCLLGAVDCRAVISCLLVELDSELIQVRPGVRLPKL